MTVRKYSVNIKMGTTMVLAKYFFYQTKFLQIVIISFQNKDRRTTIRVENKSFWVQIS